MCKHPVQAPPCERNKWFNCTAADGQDWPYLSHLLGEDLPEKLQLELSSCIQGNSCILQWLISHSHLRSAWGTQVPEVCRFRQQSEEC